MAPLKPASRMERETEKRVNSIIVFAVEIEAQLSTPTWQTASTDLINKLEKNIQIFPNTSGSAAASRCGDLDKSGTMLWNLCTRLKRDSCHDDEDSSLILAMARLYAFLILHFAQNNGKGSFTNGVRVMKVALKTARNCLELRQLDFALKALEKAAELDENLMRPTSQLTPEDVEMHTKLSAEYFVLRTMLEWRQDRLEVAEHMYKKASLSGRLLDPNTAENLADLLFEMGQGLLSKAQFELAVKWLDRAYEVLNSQELDKLSVDASELRTSIIQCSVQALLGVQQQDATEKASNLVDMLECEVGDKLVVLLLRLEVLSVSSDVFESANYSAVVQRIIRTVALTEANFKLVMHHIKKINDKSPSLACNVLDELLQTRVFKAEKEEWVETALINRLWMATSQRDGADVLHSVRQVLIMTASNIEKPISSSAAFAAQMLLWKRIESNAAMGQHDVAEEWCHVAMHKVFENAGELNKAKISRKLLICALARQDIGGAREIYSSLSEAAKRDPKTQFLLYKIAIRSRDTELASECLEAVHNASEKDPSLLYACILDAQHVGDKDLAISALQLVLDKYQYNAPATVHVPALLRCTIRLLISQLESKGTLPGDFDLDHIINQLCKIFEGAATQAQKCQAHSARSEPLFDLAELEWFSKNSYNLSLKHVADWRPRSVLRIIQSCIQFIMAYPKDVDRHLSDDLSLRQIFCHFLATVLLVSLARAEDNIEFQLQDYLMVRKHVENFDKSLEEKLKKLEEGPAEDLVKKLSILLAYDFEAAVRLKDWDNLGVTIKKAGICNSVKVYELMADCILSCEAPQGVIISTLKRIINEVWELDNFDIVKLSRYMRCLIQYSLPEAGQVAEGLLDQACNLAREASETDISYPAEELEWIATTAFNRAVDFYCTGEDDQCKNWAAKAITIASYFRDKGVLQATLEEKLLGLNWNA